MKSAHLFLLVLVGTVLAAGPVTFLKPGLITSIGQSSDIAVIKVLLNNKMKLGLDAKPLAQVADLANIKSLILVVGASTKGLGAAGLNVDQETERAKALLKAAKERGAQILVMHTGGEARRGKTTNDLISLVVPEAEYVVVVAGGNKDKLFQSLAAKRGTPVMEVDTLAAAGEAVKAVFKE
jgi:hypothetical protein